MKTMSEARSIRVILFSDVVDSSGLMFSDETTTIQLIERDLAAFSDGINRWGGELIKNTGDGILAIFSTSSQALDFIKEFLQLQQTQDGQTLQHRFGLHIGEIYHKNSDVIGQGVHLAARLQTISPVNGVAFTQGTHANIDPRFRSLASQLGTIRLKGIPEEIICFGIGEAQFLGRTTEPGTTEVPSGADRSSDGEPHPDPSDTQAISRFISEQKQLIVEQPVKAAAALSDYVQDRTHLLVGARDILTRPEWARILADSPQTKAEVALTSTRLSNWLSTSFSARTATPWIAAIGGSIPASGSASGTATEEEPSSRRSVQLGRPALIAACASGVALLVITTAFLGNRLRPAPAIPGGNGVSSGTTRQIDIDRSPEGQQQTPGQLGRSPLPDPVQEAIGADGELGSAGAGGDPAGATSDAQQAAPSSGGGGASWQRIQSALEDGLINPNDLTLADGVDHWVQSFSEQGQSAVIRLRTRQPVGSEACAQILANYQRTYRRSTSVKPWVILESSRADGSTDAGGFLPTCQLSPQGLLTTGRR